MSGNPHGALSMLLIRPDPFGLKRSLDEEYLASIFRESRGEV